MNRSIALFVALVILLAHILAIHNDGDGNFAFPYDQAYVVFRLASNLVHEGGLVWNPGYGSFESYSSPLWIAIAAIGERLSYPVFLFCQSTGVLASLFTVVLLAQFRAERIAGLIAPLLFVTSGCIAAAAANGLETAAFTLFATAAFWCFERGLALRLALAMTMCCLLRTEGIVFVAGLFALALRTGRAPVGPAGRRGRLWPYVVPLAAVALVALVRRSSTGTWSPPAWTALADPYPGQLADGIAYLVDFVRVSVSALLLVFPLYALARGRLSVTGGRALLLTTLWVVQVAFRGRAPLPFAEALVPALPFLFLAVQEAMTEVLDGVSMLRRRLAITALFLAIGGSALASKIPADIGPIRIGRWHERWMASSGSARFGYEQPLGRLGLEQEIERTNRLRAIGLFLRDHVATVDPTQTVLSPWPGSMAYLSHMVVWDVLGRTNPVPGREGPASWTRRERSDVVALLRQDPPFDYVVPLLEPRENTPTVEEIARVWATELDSLSGDPGRVGAIEQALSAYEMIDVPIYGFNRGPIQPRGQKMLLLRHRGLRQQPVVELVLHDRRFRVELRHKSHQQVVDLWVELRGEQGGSWTLRPNGEPTTARVHARTSILVYNAGERAIELLRGELPERIDGERVVEIRAGLRNPRCVGDHGFAATSEVARAEL